MAICALDKLILTWEDFDRAVEVIAEACDAPRGVCGVPRGGLILAVALSHAFECPLVNEPGPDVLVVDDVVETGAALRAFAPLAPPHRLWTWVSKGSHPGVRSCMSISEETWVVFPWERLNRAAMDALDYRRRRIRG